MRFKIFVITMMAVMMIVACDSKERVKAPGHNPQAAAPQQAMGNAHTVLVKEVIQAKSYTYLFVTEDSQEYWIATAKQPFDAGMTLHYDEGLEMQDFTSKEIERTFDSIFFVGQMRGTSSASAQASSGKKAMEPSKDISIEKVAGGVSIQELYANKADYDGKVVSVRGQVTKFNAGIMGRNWVHLQDGTKSGDAFDLTITTQAVVSKDDVVVFSGKVALNKDFGAGYKYDLIMEEADLSAES
ncbi:MAG: DNA-binding protein [Candidatus Marinimicrobia bacterium]|nr:DNA-binding protein [Candidatus Neomarinimicrobiota bacterium]MBT3630636.1 DNA-binding protein [Candidatus Neomarinimicrobiota bacterium]MBT3825074.1 DNA-binding protein [Candidatus Neomarinimicrobiota bacterium]MBT4132580.1 DNA-binding protein [Candidatus Neomarinimicrobiota bacterium]MBT4295586.1 DNA-binding protein [Candidatus Neomarinimicrobiota bacterium]